MKLKINRDKLADIVARGVSGAPKNSPAVLANNARIVARGGTLYVASTDFQMMVEASGECEMERPGAITVDAAKFKQTVDRLPKGVEVTLTIDDAKKDMILKAGRSRVTFPTLAVEDWPARDYKKDGAEFVLEGADLVRLFSHTTLALSPLPNSPLQGVFFHIRAREDRLAAVGTTGMVFILATIPAPEGAEDMPDNGGRPGVTLSADTINSVLKLFRSAEEVKVTVNDQAIFFQTETTHFCSSLLLGEYPNYATILSNPVEAKVVVARETCANAVALLEPFTDKEMGHRMQCAGSDEGFVLAVGSQTGGGVDVVEAQITGEFKAFGINSSWMKSVLGAFKSSSISLHPDVSKQRLLFLAEDEPNMIGAVGMMNIPTELATGPKQG